MSKLKYFISWLAIVLATLTVIVAFILLVTFTKHFDNPGGIYFYLYFIFPPLWILLIPLYTLIGMVISSWRKGVSYFASLLVVNIVTGVIGVAGAFGCLMLLSLQGKASYEKELARQRAHLDLKNVQVIPQEVTDMHRFNTLLLQYTLTATQDIGTTDTFITVGRQSGSNQAIMNSPWIMTMDDDTYERVQTITKGNWSCEVLLTQYRWDEQSLIALKSASTLTETAVQIEVRNDPVGDRLPDDILLHSSPLDIDFRTLSFTTPNKQIPLRPLTNKKPLCTKMT